MPEQWYPDEDDDNVMYRHGRDESNEVLRRRREVEWPVILLKTDSEQKRAKWIGPSYYFNSGRQDGANGEVTLQQLEDISEVSWSLFRWSHGGNVRVNPTYSKNPVKSGNTVNRPTQSNPVRTAAKANNTVVSFNCNQPGHIRPNCPFPDKDRRIAGTRIEEVILEEDEEEQQDWEDQSEEDDQQYHFNNEEYETRSIDNEVVHVNAVIKASGYNSHHRLYEIRVQESETDMRVSAVVKTGGKKQPVYDH
ncbi:hypothetical protein M422DRAFT_243796 [Sphaerobolus stellatus SS14]|nr:hypothetical protein M422DRAFT_243796 [Sphaerobolus stellatus SS14]